MFGSVYGLPKFMLSALFINVKLGFFKRCYLFIFKDGEGRRKRGREILMCERNIDRLPLELLSNGDGPQPRHVPDQESNWQPFVLRDDTPN